jgi:transposase
MTNHHKKTSPRYSPEVRDRAVRMVFDHAGEYTSQWAAIESIAAKIDCATQTLHTWVARAERDQGLKPGPTSEERELRRTQ